MMLGSPVLGAAVGLVMLFATTSLLCSGVTESLSNLFQMRAKYLLTGLRAMLDGPDGGTKSMDKQLHEAVKKPDETTRAAQTMAEMRTTKAGSDPVDDAILVTKALFDSPLLNSLQSRRVRPGKPGSVRNPQYISGRMFARALVDTLVPATPDAESPVVVTIGELQKAAAKLPSPTLKRQLAAFLSTAGDSVGAFEASVERWYDEEMAKISGWYKRWARVALGITGLIVAVLFNLDTLQVAHTLYVDVPVQQAVLATADSGTLCQNTTDPEARRKCASDELAQLKADALPIGWPDPDVGTPGGFVLKVIGWGLTAFAVSFGAPFWFEALSKLGSLRNAGTRPADRPT